MNERVNEYMYANGYVWSAVVLCCWRLTWKANHGKMARTVLMQGEATHRKLLKTVIGPRPELSDRWCGWQRSVCSLDSLYRSAVLSSEGKWFSCPPQPLSPPSTTLSPFVSSSRHPHLSSLTSKLNTHQDARLGTESLVIVVAGFWPVTTHFSDLLQWKCQCSSPRQHHLGSVYVGIHSWY